MARLLVVTSHLERLGSKPVNNLRKQLDYLETLSVETDLMIDPTPLKFELAIRKNTYDVVYLTPMRRPDEKEEDIRLFNYHTELTRLLQLLNQPFIGQDFTSQLSINDKMLCSYVSGLHPQGWLITRQFFKEKETLKALSNIPEEAFPVLIKPNTLWAGLGIGEDSIAFCWDEVLEKTNIVFLRFPALNEIRVEKLITKCREATVSILGNGENLVTGITELVSGKHGRVLNGEEEKTATVVTKRISYKPWPQDEWRHALEKLGVQLFQKFAFRDIARFDILVSKTMNVIDVNDMPFLGNAFSTDWKHQYNIEVDHLLALILATFHSRYPINLAPVFWDAIPEAFRFRKN